MFEDNLLELVEDEAELEQIRSTHFASNIIYLPVMRLNTETGEMVEVKLRIIGSDKVRNDLINPRSHGLSLSPGYISPAWYKTSEI